MNIDVGFDLDGVGYNFIAGYLRYLREIGESTEQVKVPSHPWNFYEALGHDFETFVMHCDNAVEAGILFATGDPYPGFVKAGKRLKKAGARIHVVTNRFFGADGASRLATEVWLDEIEFPYDTLTLTADKASVGTDFFIEDRIDNYDVLATWGSIPYLVDRPWNAVEGGDTRRRVPDALAFANEVLRRANGN